MAEWEGMTLKQKFLRFWIGGLVLFAIVIAIGLPLGIEEVPGGILDHQAAGTDVEVDRIQQAWMAAGLYGHARIAMLGDLVFIGIYGVGSLLGGIWLWREHAGLLRTFGAIVALAAVTFLITDYTETIAQFIQLTSKRGDWLLASLAAEVRPIKVAAWLVTFVGLLAALLIRQLSAPRA